MAAVSLALGLGTVGCYEGLSGAADGDGASDDGGDDGGEAQSLCEVPTPGPAPIRRLTRAEYSNTIRDLLGDDSRPGDDFVGEDVIHGFDNNAAGGSMSRLLAEQYETAAKAIAQRAVEDLPALLGCDPVADESGCIDQFTADFGRRAYRRPLTPDELAQVRGFYDGHRAETDVGEAVRLTVSAILQSPKFLYRVEYGDPSTERDGAVLLGDYEVATRLSYLLWNSMPDEPLFEAAGAGELRTSEQIGEQAARMLADARARDVLMDFHEQWLSLRGGVPSALADMEQLLREETRTFVANVIVDGDGRLDTLLRADYTYLNRELAEFYGLDAAGMTDQFERVDLDPTRRTGLMTHAVLLAINAEEHETSPIKRGRFVREQLMCQTLPPPPPGLEVEPPDPDPNKTTRERYAEHRSDPACMGCHVLIDPLGFSFEHYDHFGQWRDEENGLPIDASGEVTASKDGEIDGPFDGVVELADRLADSSMVEECVVTNWFRYAYGREEVDVDDCTMNHLAEVFAQNDGSVQALLIALTQTDAFRFRPAEQG